MSVRDLRIPFEVAVNDKKLMAETWKRLSMPQQVALKAFYGMSLGTKVDALGRSELDYWAASQGFAEYDDLGYITGVDTRGAIAPRAGGYHEGWAIWGRRAGKTDGFGSTIVAYEAALGGHEAHIRKGQKGVIFQIAQDLRMARYSLHFIRATLEESPLLAKEIENVTADRIDLRNGMSIAVIPPSLKSVRGYAIPVAVLDEVGVWYQDSEAANPDYEIYRAVSPGQIQFPNRKLIGISSPWNKAGLLYQAYEAGSDGHRAGDQDTKERYEGVLVHHAPTAAMANPKVDVGYLKKQRRKDPRAFERENLAIFQDSISGFLSPTLINEAVDREIHERPPQSNFHYVAAIDPAFRRDAFGFTIFHADPQRGMVQDLVRRWKAEEGIPLNPEVQIANVAMLARQYGCSVVYTDQYHIESLSQLAMRHNISLSPCEFSATSKAKIYGSLQQLVNQRRLKLLDNKECLRELKMLEAKLTQGGTIQIQAPPGEYDDLAACCAIAAHQGLWMLPALEKPAELEKPITTHDVLFERFMKTKEKQARYVASGLGGDSWD